MGKKKKIIKIIIIIVVVALIVPVSYGIYFFFGKKDYTFYERDKMGEYEFLEIHITDENSRKEIVLNDEDIIEDVKKELKNYKVKPKYIFKDTTSDVGFSIVFYDGDNNEFMFLGTLENGKCIIDVGIQETGYIENGVKADMYELIGYASMDIDDGEKLYEYLGKLVEENEKTITIDDILKFSEEKEDNWLEFKEYKFTEQEGRGEVEVNGMPSEEPARFEIDGYEGYMIVRYIDSGIITQSYNERYIVVCDAFVYNESGERCSIYDEGIKEFLGR